MPPAVLSQISDATHTWFWFFVALFTVGLFLGVGGVLRTTLSVIDRSSRFIAGTGGLLLAGGLAGALLVAAGAPGSMTAAMSDMVGMGTAAAAPAPPPKHGAPKVAVTGVDFTFDPATLTVPANETVDVTFRNAGQSPHTFTVVGKGFELKADPGHSTTGALPKLPPGRYQFICSIPGHAQLGMTGTLVVGSG